MLEALIGGQASPEQMAELAKGRLREKREALVRALTGRVKAHHRFLLTELLCQIDSLEETIARFDQEIADYVRPFEETVVLLDTIPGIARATAEAIVADRNWHRHEPLPDGWPSGRLGRCRPRQL